MEQRTSPLDVTNRAILKIAVPMAAGFLTTPLVGIADTAVVGQLGDPVLIGGVAVASILLGLLLTSFNFLRSATSALTAQAHGRDDPSAETAVLLRSSLIAVVTGVAIVVLQGPVLALGLWIMSPSAAVADATSAYFLTRVWATPFTLLNFVFLSWLVGVDRPILCFALQSFLNLFNVALTVLFVLQYDMGVSGAALATVIAEVSTVLLTLPLLAKPVLTERGRLLAMMFDREKLFMMMRLNADILVRSFCLQAAFAFFTRQSAQQSDAILAANEILLHFFMVAGYFLDGFAIAVEQFVGRAMGARSKATFERAVRLTSLWNLGQAALLSLIFFAIGHPFIDFMTPNEEVRALCKTYLVWAALTPLVGVAAFQMDGVFIGATWSRDMRNSMLVSLAVMIVAYFILFPPFQNHGLWLALWIFLSLRAITLYQRMTVRRKETFTSSQAEQVSKI
ncbi:MAG: MATE family efflux transporter [Pseudomonadota bacterium]